MVHTRPVLPAGHGELLADPEVREWPALLERARNHSASWELDVAGVRMADLVASARTEAIEAARSFSARLGVPVREPGPAGGLVVMTGHQPELYHPGIWVKDFLLDSIGAKTGATAIDLVVDSDGFDQVKLATPCMAPIVRRCEEYLAVGGADVCYACSAVPSRDELSAFCRAGDEALATLKAPSVRRHFSEFCACLDSASKDALNLAELVTFARRRYEASAGTGYLELPVTHLVRTPSYARFLSHVALNAEEFARAYNAELADFRSVAKVRSAAQPFPDLGHQGGRIELPFWYLTEDGRRTAWALPDDGGVSIVADGESAAYLPQAPEAAARALIASGAILAPKALALTLYARVFLSDLFIHGVGGARYDRVTDGVSRRFFGIEPPRYVVASLTVYLPLGAHLVSEDEITAVTERLNRFEHNPDALLDEVEFDSEDERAVALSLAEEKRSLVEAISRPGVDKKATGRRIREVNAALRRLLEPIGKQLEDERDRLAIEREAGEILTDRTYPFCLWSPEDIADKVR